jgi:hypothetical protein
MTSLPGILGEIEEAAGRDAALTLARVRGGMPVYFPPRPGADHWLSRLLGHGKALAVCEQLTAGVGPRRLDLPQGEFGSYRKESANRYDLMDEMICDGRSEMDIARATGYTTRCVRRRVAKLGKPADQRQASFL